MKDGKTGGKGAATLGGGAQGGFSTIDTSFCLTKSQLEKPSDTDATQVRMAFSTDFAVSISTFDVLEAIKCNALSRATSNPAPSKSSDVQRAAHVLHRLAEQLPEP
jgi:hypothetical protein